jgi:hypothetical protein
VRRLALVLEANGVFLVMVMVVVVVVVMFVFEGVYLASDVSQLHPHVAVWPSQHLKRRQIR